ncbi:MAG: hypothetical protein ABIT64_01695, partial [Lysobacteraceae bacterium]
MIFLLALLCTVASGCQRDPQPSASPSSADAVEARSTFANDQHVWRMQRSEKLLMPDGWTSLIGLHWIDPGPHYVGSNADNGIRLAMGPAQFGMLDRNDNRIRLVPNRSAGLTLDGVTLSSAT